METGVLRYVFTQSRAHRYVIPVVGLLSLVLSCVSVGVLAFVTPPGPSPRAGRASSFAATPTRPPHGHQHLASAQRSLLRTKSCSGGRPGGAYVHASSGPYSPGPHVSTPEEATEAGFTAHPQRPAPTRTMRSRGSHGNTAAATAPDTAGGGHDAETGAAAATTAAELAKSPLLGSLVVVV